MKILMDMGPQVNKTKITIRRKSIIIGLRVFIALSVLTITTLLIFTATRETGKALLKVNPIYLLLILGLLSLYIILEATRIRLIAYAITGNWIPITYALQVIFCGAFLSAVTPFQAGGAPIQIYILWKAGLKWGETFLLLILRGIFYLLALALFFPVILPYFQRSYTGRSMQILSKYSIFAYLLILGAFLLILFYPKPLKKLLYSLTYRRGKRTDATRRLFGFVREVRRMRRGFFDFVKKRKLLSIGILIFTIIVYIPNYSIALLILHSLSIKAPYIDTIFRQIFLIFSAFFFPTPGAEGIIEGGFTVLFYNSVPKYLIGVFAILWRFFTYQLIVIIGGFLSLKLLRMKKILSR
ncbi:MAG TPA: flippase-like domain-containing protein [candidate division WOR-3 bacterium]|uniref:Flippase-like domain-containing protein n=1 Tax=candidate division WOR-3 bacterium TaxID=2052148 RepID=A0A7C5HFV7_UNCW3|nr:flippase-like domain-containing protein [candidate division WOR-3 bacterium]